MEENITRTMTPFQSGNEYYKKMLDLQERLRKSEEERIRLEARFSLLEHESRNRHETCINRLRMRYIEFLEEQQSRDERNHQLLGALDRVDSSLALMSAKTDRLGILRKQYEASLLASYENRRPNGSVTGDSGVASQNDERQRRNDELSRGYRNDSVTLVNRDMIVGSGQASPNDRVKNSPSQRVRSGSSYTGNWSRIHCESIPSVAFSRFPQGSSMSNARDAISNFENSKSFLQPKNSRRESSIQSFPYKTSQDPTIYDSRFARGDYPSLQNIESGNPATTLKYDRSVVRDLANSGAYETTKRVPKFFEASPGHYRDSNPRLATSRNSAEDFPRGNAIFPSNSSWDEGNFKPGSSSPKSPKFSDILRQELGDEEEHIGNMVENQLERYITKIRSLHRDADPQSLDEMDHEQNTSGDLLNVTLSDDETDFPIEEKSRVRGLLSQELGNVLALADDLANQTCHIDEADENNQRISGTGVRLSAETPSLNDGKFIDEDSHVRNNVKSDAVQRVTSINRRPRYSDETGTFEEPRNSEKIGLLAKNGINVDVTKPRAKLASRSARNIEDIAKINGNSVERDLDDTDSSRVASNEMGQDESGISNRENESKYRLMSGEERETGENLCDITEDLEPWNISALERRVQEIILNDEAQNDFIARGGAKRSSRDDGSSRKTSDHVEQAVSGIYDEWDEPDRSNDRKTEALIAEDNQQPTETKDPRKNDENIGHEETISHGEANGDASPLMNDKNARLDQDKDVSSSNIAAESVDQLPQESRTKSDETENVGGIDDVVEEYQGDNAQYQQYNLDNNGEQYGYVDQQYPNHEYPQNYEAEYVQDPNQAEYAQNPNQGDYQQDPNQAEYIQDSNQGEYQQDPNQTEYIQDLNQAEYIQDPNQAEYIQDSNQGDYQQDPNQAEYVQDSNQGEYQQDPNQAEYIQDPNQAEYIQDSNQGDYQQDPNQAEYIHDSNQGNYQQDPNQAEYIQDSNQAEYVQDFNQADYVQDPNQQYTTEPNIEYAADSNQQYGMNPSQEYSEDPNQQYTVDPNDQYLADPNLEYSTDPNKKYTSESDHNQEYTSESGLNQQYASESGLNQQSVLESDSDQQPLQEDVQNDDSRSQERPVNDQSGENLDPDATDGKDYHQNGDDDQSASGGEMNIPPTDKLKTKTTKDVIKSLLDSDTESTIERNVSNTESDFDFN